MPQKFNRRTAIAAGAFALAAVSPATYSRSKEEGMDKALEDIEERMTRVDGRGASLSVKEKYLVLLAVLTTTGGTACVAEAVEKALRDGVTPVAVKEAVYQCGPYVGLQRVRSVLPEVNRAMKKAGVKLPLPDQSTVDDKSRLAKGIRVQTAIFGEAIAKMHANAADEDRSLIVDDLSGYCFGDFYTRKGLTVAERELVTFMVIAALGGCEPQLKAHAAANIKEGNGRRALIDALQIAVPYLGFPRTLNALAVVKEVSRA